jgi:hypothetical protein
MLRPVFVISLVALSAVLAACQDASAETCPPLLSEVRSRLVEQGVAPATPAFQTRYANAMRACLQDPVAFRGLFGRAGE